MASPERLKQLLKESVSDVERMADWMKDQEPLPGQSYKEWLESVESKGLRSQAARAANAK